MRFYETRVLRVGVELVHVAAIAGCRTGATDRGFVGLLQFTDRVSKPTLAMGASFFSFDANPDARHRGSRDKRESEAVSGDVQPLLVHNASHPPDQPFTPLRVFLAYRSGGARAGGFSSRGSFRLDSGVSPSLRFQVVEGRTIVPPVCRSGATRWVRRALLGNAGQGPCVTPLRFIGSAPEIRAFATGRRIVRTIAVIPAIAPRVGAATPGCAEPPGKCAPVVAALHPESRFPFDTTAARRHRYRAPGRGLR